MPTPSLQAPHFDPGFRLSPTVAGVLVIGLFSAVAPRQVNEGLAVAIIFVVSHFFVFCNVLRMFRPLELSWAGVFLGLALLSQRFHLFSWTAAFMIALVCTGVVAALAVRSPSYHGVGWRRFNPALLVWWESAI